VTAETTFDAIQDTLGNLLKEIRAGRMQLPDFQRGWVWDDHHIKSLVTSVSRSFPIGAVMTLRTGGDVRFKPRLVEGVHWLGEPPQPDRLILDGQQRLTSLFQSLTLARAITTRDDKGRPVDRWYYVDMDKSLGDPAAREDAIISIPGDKQIRRDFGREIVLDLSTSDKEYENGMFPLHQVLDSDTWMMGWFEHWNFDRSKIELFNKFKREFIQVFHTYQIPIIELKNTTGKEAVCLVFEKVNTGGVSLTAFELLTATYAAESDSFNLREDWFGDPKGAQDKPGRLRRMGSQRAILKTVENTDFLQAVSLLFTYRRRNEARAAGKSGADLPPISCTRQSILQLPLSGYLAHADAAEEGFKRAAQFLWREKVFTGLDLPYRTQLVPLAAILVTLGDRWKDDSLRRRVRQWYWCGVFGELYGSAIESRFARDLPEVVAWITDNGPTPITIEESNFVSERLRTLRSRLSAAYKGLHALLMQQAGACDWRTGARVDEQTYFDEAIDIHHVFPRAWCENEKRKIPNGIYNSIVNKTALSASTNRMIGGDAPSSYLRRLQRDYDIDEERMDGFLRTHLIEPDQLRTDDFLGMIVARGEALLAEIQEATGRSVGGPPVAEVFGASAATADDDVEGENAA
jgi:hypothetical protein